MEVVKKKRQKSMTNVEETVNSQFKKTSLEQVKQTA